MDSRRSAWWASSRTRVTPHRYNDDRMPAPLKYHSDEERKAAQKLARQKYEHSPKGKATYNRYRQSEKGKEAQRRWDTSEAGRAKQARYRKTAKWREVRRRHRQTERFRLAEAARRSRSPEKVTARSAVNNALKSGRLTKPTSCERCGERRPQAHHYLGYAPEHHLAVRWLCTWCHSLAHAPRKSRH